MAELAPLPDPSIIDSFNPLEYLFDGNQGISEIPDHPDFLLRWWPRLRRGQTLTDTYTLDDVWQYSDERSLDLATNRAEEQFRLLGKLGIPVLEPGRDIIRFAGSADKVALPGVVQFSIVRRYRGAPLQPTDALGRPLVAKYTSYLTAALKSGFILHDVLKPQQHLILDEPDPQQPIKLIDTEPMVVPVWGPLTNGEQAFRYCRVLLERWAEQVGSEKSVLLKIGELAQQSEHYTNIRY